ncbi:MAG: hypothetical protein WBX08_06530 [Candidatus Sulfotelmatobacter sp.]
MRSPDDVDRMKLQGKVLTYICSKCGETNTTNPDEDFSQAAARHSPLSE